MSNQTIDPERGQWTSASAAEADTLCHARHNRCLGLPEPERNQDADRGTRIHATLAGDAVSPPLDADESDCAGRLNELEIEAVRIWEDGSEPAAYDVLREERLWIEVNGLKHSGKPDVVYLDAVDGRALVIDYKTGRGDVTDSPKNLQLRDLACLVAHSHSVYEVTVCILQPFNRPLLCKYSANELSQALQELEDRVIACHSESAKANPGETQCKYCRAKATCPEFLAAFKPAEIMPGPGNIPPTVEQVSLSIAKLDGFQLGIFLGLVRLASDCAETEVRKRLTEGQSVDGWKLGEPGKRETVTDPNTVHQRFVEAGGTTAQFMPAVTVAKSKLKAALKEATGAKGKALDARMSALLEGCVEVKDTAAKLERS